MKTEQKPKTLNIEYDLNAMLQPIVSVVQKKIVGFEGLVRGYDKVNNCILYPKEIFSIPKNMDETIILDRACRNINLEAFKVIHSINKDIFMFLNMDTSIIKHVCGSSYLNHQVEKNGINPHNVVIEINESKIEDLTLLQKFVEEYKARGFLIALDDVGSGFSNFDRITIVKPDILKIDRSLIENIGKNHYKAEVFQSLVRMANTIGTLVVAEGVETKEEVMKCIEYGAHFLQGYYFAKPQKINISVIKYVDEIIKNAHLDFKKYMNKKIEVKKRDIQQLDFAVNSLIKLLNHCSEDQARGFINSFLTDARSLNLECAYILDSYGVQKTETFFINYSYDERRKMVFYPAETGTDHSLKKYYYELSSATTKYCSEAYISSATGNTCVTISRIYKDRHGNDNILCIDKRIE